MRTGMAGGLPLPANLALKAYRRPPLSRGPLLSKRAMDDRGPPPRASLRHPRGAVGAAHQPCCRAATSNGPYWRGSSRRGRRCWWRPPPTRGLDVAAIQAIRRLLLEEREAGTAILMISEDLEEIMELSDEIVVLYEGRDHGQAGTGAGQPGGLGDADGGPYGGPGVNLAVGAREIVVERRPLPPLWGAGGGAHLLGFLRPGDRRGDHMGCRPRPGPRLHRDGQEGFPGPVAADRDSGDRHPPDPDRTGRSGRLPYEDMEHRRRRPAHHGRGRLGRDGVVDRGRGRRPGRHSDHAGGGGGGGGRCGRRWPPCPGPTSTPMRSYRP